MAEWIEMGILPGSDALFCKEHCHCSLEETEDAAAGDLGEVPVRRAAADDAGEGGAVENRNARVWLNWAKGELRNRRREGGALGEHALPCDAAVWVAAEKRLLRSAAGSVG